jgi:hypothetical protein
LIYTVKLYYSGVPRLFTCHHGVANLGVYVQVSIVIDSALGYDVIAGQLRQFADRMDGKAGASAAGKATTAAAPVATAANGATAKEPRKRATAAEMEARRVAEAAAAAGADDGLGVADDGLDGGDGLEADAPTLTLEQVIDAGKAYALTNGREAAGKVLQRFGVKSVRDLKPAQFALAHAAFNT